MASEEDWESYRTAVVDLYPSGRSPLRITPDSSGTTGVWPDWLPAPLYVVTAWNPDSVRMPVAVNHARHARLIAELEAVRREFFPAVGRDVAGSYAEEGVAVTGLTEQDARAIGRRHGQAAVYAWTPDAWTVVACAGTRREQSGWRIDGRPGQPDPSAHN